MNFSTGNVNNNNKSTNKNNVRPVSALHQLSEAVSSINSYLGLLSHHSEYNNRKRILSLIESPAYEFCYIKGSYEVLSLKNKYKPLNY